MSQHGPVSVIPTNPGANPTKTKKPMIPTTIPKNKPLNTAVPSSTEKLINHTKQDGNGGVNSTRNI